MSDQDRIADLERQVQALTGMVQALASVVAMRGRTGRILEDPDAPPTLPHHLAEWEANCMEFQLLCAERTPRGEGEAADGYAELLVFMRHLQPSEAGPGRS